MPKFPLVYCSDGRNFPARRKSFRVISRRNVVDAVEFKNCTDFSQQPPPLNKIQFIFHTMIFQFFRVKFFFIKFSSNWNKAKLSLPTCLSSTTLLVLAAKASFQLYSRKEVHKNAKRKVWKWEKVVFELHCLKRAFYINLCLTCVQTMKANLLKISHLVRRISIFY